MWERNLCEKHRRRQQAYYLSKHTYDNSRIRQNFSIEEIAAGELIMREEYEQIFGKPADDKTKLKRISLGSEEFLRSENHFIFHNYEEEIGKMMESEEIKNDAEIEEKRNIDDDRGWIGNEIIQMTKKKL